GVAVARRMRRRVGCEVARRTGACLDIHVLLPVGAEPVGHHAPDDVGRAARCVADENPHRLAGVLRLGAERKEQSKQKDRSHSWENILLPAKGMSTVRISPFSESVM